MLTISDFYQKHAKHFFTKPQLWKGNVTLTLNLKSTFRNRGEEKRVNWPSEQVIFPGRGNKPHLISL